MLVVAVPEADAGGEGNVKSQSADLIVIVSGG